MHPLNVYYSVCDRNSIDLAMSESSSNTLNKRHIYDVLTSKKKKKKTIVIFDIRKEAQKGKERTILREYLINESTFRMYKYFHYINKL